MLDCRRDRLDYGEMLRPPSGCRLDRAMAATYSVDLGTVLSIPVALVYAHTMEGDLTGARFQLLEAIKQFSNRVRVYHQAGQLHVPAKLNWLYAHLEDALVPILPEDAFTAFHPKIWVIRFVPQDGGETDTDRDAPSRFRVIVLSRNLTFDRSWDVAASLEGDPGPIPIGNNSPLIDFLRWMISQDPRPTAWANDFLEELARVDFKTPEPFDRHAFHPLGVPGHAASPTDGMKSRRTVVLSPFLDAKTIRRLREQTQEDLHLFSQGHELENLPAALRREIQSYSLHPVIVEGESIEAAEEGNSDIQKQQLHAKVFVLGAEGETRWYLGSANATEAARDRNVEFLLGMAGTSPKVCIEPLLKNLIGESEGDGPFLPFDPQGGEEADPQKAVREQEERKFKHALLKAAKEANAWVEPSRNRENYDLHVQLDLRGVPKRNGFKVYVQPLNVKSKRDRVRLQPGKPQKVVFRSLGEVELSRFLQFRIEGGQDEGTSHEFLFRIEIANLPQGRLENILRKIIDSSDKFFEYLRFLLDDEITKEDLLAASEEGRVDMPPPADRVQGWHSDLPVYEQLLVVASRNPRKLKELNELIEHLAGERGGRSARPSVIPDEFLSFWKVFLDWMARGETKHA